MKIIMLVWVVSYFALPVLGLLDIVPWWIAIAPIIISSLSVTIGSIWGLYEGKKK